MTPEQDKAMMAVLKSIAEARRTGLTEKQIENKIAITGKDTSPGLDGAMKVLAVLDPNDKLDPDDSHPRTDLIASRVLAGDDLTDEGTPMSALDVPASKKKKRNKKS